MKKSNYSYIATALILSVIALCVTGCLTMTSEAVLADGSSFKSTGTSVGSKSAAENIQSSWTLNPTNATKSIEAAGLTTQGQFAEAGGMLGQVAYGAAAGARGGPIPLTGLTGRQILPVQQAPAPPWELLGITEERWAQIQSFVGASDRNRDAPASSVEE